MRGQTLEWGNANSIQILGGALAVQVNPNLMKKMIDTLGYSENSNKLSQLLFVIAEKLWKLGKIWKIRC